MSVTWALRVLVKNVCICNFTHKIRFVTYSKQFDACISTLHVDVQLNLAK